MPLSAGGIGVGMGLCPGCFMVHLLHNLSWKCENLLFKATKLLVAWHSEGVMVFIAFIAFTTLGPAVQVLNAFYYFHKEEKDLFL